MNLRKWPALAALLVVFGFSVRSPAESEAGRTAAPADFKSVTVFAAASLTAAFQRIATAFEQEHADTKVQLNFAGSAALVQQIQQGAPADVFASADEANMQKLADDGGIAGTAQLFARNQLAIAVGAGNPKGIGGLADLTKPGLVIALCGPTVPCGRYAAEAFSKAGVAVPPASQEIDVKGVVSKVALGEADAGVVYVTDVRAAGAKVVGVALPESVSVVARYPIAALKDAPNPAAAAAFIDFVLSPTGQHVLGEFGFLPR